MTQNEQLLKGILTKLDVVKGPDGRGEYVAWCPFHADGNGRPPHQPNLSVSVRGFYCHACTEKGGLGKLAEKLGIEVDHGSDEVVKTYDYKDANGELLHQVIRSSGKRFRQRRPDGKGNWIWNVKGVKRVPYRLPDIVNSPDDIVYIVEGEKDADRMASEGVTATTNPGGAGKWRDELSSFLKDRQIIILPDNDATGKRHAESVASSLNSIAKRIKVIELPDLPDKGDVSDWLDSGKSIDDLKLILSVSPEWEPNTSNQPEEQKDKRESQATKILKLIPHTGIELFHDQRLEPYCVLRLAGGRKILSLSSADFKNWLGRLAWEEHKIAASGDTLNTVTQTLKGQARFDFPECPLYVRCAKIDSDIWIDLDGCRAVRISPGSWEIISEPPIMFRSFAHQQPLPDPVRGGDPWEIFRFLNIHDENTKLLLVSYLVAALLPDIPVTLLLVHGVHGSAKTTLLKMVKSILDPSQVMVRGSIRDQNEFAQAASQNRVLFFDNLSRVPEWLSDALCRAVTGEGWTKRKLYTDEDSIIFQYRIAVGLSGINPVADKPDLLDRSLIISLDPLSPDQRKPERTFWKEFEKVRPSILGGIFDALAQAMLIEPTLELGPIPRMADFATWGAAAASALGKTPSDFLKAYEGNILAQNEVAVDFSPVALALLTFMEDRHLWEGSPTDLLGELEQIAGELKIDLKGKTWPKTPSWLTRRLREIEPNLLALGISIEDDRCRTHRIITLRKIGENAVTDVTETPSNTDAETGSAAVPERLFIDDADVHSLKDELADKKAEEGETSKDQWPKHVAEAFEERFAIQTLDGGLSEEEARKQALDYVKREHPGAFRD